MTNSGDHCTYGELVRSRKEFYKFVAYDFDPEVALKIARLARWAAVQYADYDAVRTKLEARHAKRASDGSFLLEQRIPGTFQVKDPEAWARDDGLLSAGKVRLPTEDLITADDVAKIRGQDGEAMGPACPDIIAGLGPFFAWPESESEHHSVADDIWQAIERSDGKDIAAA